MAEWAPKALPTVGSRLGETVWHYDRDYSTGNDQARVKQRQQDPFARSQRVIRPRSRPSGGGLFNASNKQVSLAQQHQGPTGRPMGMPPRGAGAMDPLPDPFARVQSATRSRKSSGSAAPSPRGLQGVLPPNSFSNARAPRNQLRRGLRPISTPLKRRPATENSATDAAAAGTAQQPKSSRSPAKTASKRRPLLIGAYTNTPGGLAKPKLGTVGGVPTKRISSSGLAKLTSSPFGTINNASK